MDYNVRLEFALPPIEASGDTLVDALATFHPAAGPVGNGNIDVWITLPAGDVHQAVELGLALAGKATDARLLAIEVLPTEDFDRREGLTPVPDLIGADEAAEILGISRQAVGKRFNNRSLPGHRVGDRVIVFARRDVEAAAGQSKPSAVR